MSDQLPIRIKRSDVEGKRPQNADLQLGELAINTYDGLLFAKKDTGGVGVGTTVVLLTPWSENPDGSIYYNDGNIGIGTTNPTSKLFVGGDGYFTGILTAQQIVSSLYGEFTGSAVVSDRVVATALSVSGISTLGTVQISSGIISATTGIVTYYGDASNLTKTFPLVTNVLYVTKNGNDGNPGTRLSEPKSTIAGAVAAATAGTVIKVSAGTYIENNPITLPDQVSIVGDSLREVTITPNNTGDLFYVGNGNYIAEMSFVGAANTGAIFSFDPNTIRYFNQSPYVQNCTNFIQNSIGMKIDGKNAIGPLKSMVVDSYTQYNQGGIGVSITNEGYAQLVSIFTICNDVAIFCGSGAACDLTNSNSSFGNYALVADGVGPRKYTGIITSAAAANADTFTLDLNVPTLNVSSALYDNVSGIVTITTSSNHNFNVGIGVSIAGLKFTCSSANTVTNYNISTANYTNTTGILTVTTSTNHNFSVGISVTMSNLVFSCNSGGGISTAYFPPAPGDNNGASNHIFNVISIPASNQFVVNVGTSTITHNYVNNGIVSISTIANFPSGNYGYVFEVVDINAANSFSAYVGVSTFSHTYVSGGTAKINVSRPFDGQIVYFENLYYTVGNIVVGSGGTGYTSTPTVTISPPETPWGVSASAVANISNGSVIGFEIISNGRGYGLTPPPIKVVD